MSNMRNTAGLIGKVADDDAPQFEGGLDDHVVQSAEPVLVEGGAAASRELQEVRVWYRDDYPLLSCCALRAYYVCLPDRVTF